MLRLKLAHYSELNQWQPDLPQNRLNQINYINKACPNNALKPEPSEIPTYSTLEPALNLENITDQTKFNNVNDLTPSAASSFETEAVNFQNPLNQHKIHSSTTQHHNISGSQTKSAKNANL